MHAQCPGSQKLKTPEILIKSCPQCGERIEIFTDEIKAECKCGFIIYNDIQTCILWCRYAEECVGSEVYDRIKNSLNKEK